MPAEKQRIGFPAMARVVKPAAQGVARVDHFTVTEKESKWTSMLASIHNDQYGHVAAGKYARLYVGGQLMMTDTAMERSTNRVLLWRANGRVFIAGLGIGMVIHGLMKKPEVDHITVVEKYQDVVDLIGPTLRKYGRRVSIVTADALDWTAPKGEKWDTIYFDIWPNVCEDNLTEAAKLSRKFSPRLNRSNPKAWMGGWRLDELRARRESSRRQGW